MTQSQSDPQTVVAPRQPIATHQVRGGGGVGLHVREWGRADGPELLFIHGWSQCDLSWTRQINSHLADEFHIVTFDLRGHGLSEKPPAREDYTNSNTWAEDLQSVIDHTGLTAPVLVAWSYGGFVVCDYLDAFGDDRLSGIAFVAGAIEMSSSFRHIGPGLLDNARGACAPDIAENITAVDRFVRACASKTPSDDELLMIFGWTMVVPPAVRAALFARELDGRDALADLSVPVLAFHGRADEIVLPSMTEELARCCPGADISWYEQSGHMPFSDAADRFNAELAQFASSCTSPA